MSEADNSKPSPHVLVIPYPAQGHFLPLLDLTHQLSLHHISITILTTPQNLSTLSPLLSTHSHVTPLIFPFPPHPLIPQGVENVRYLGISGNTPVISALSSLFDSVVEWFNGNHENPPVAIISDFFLGWTTGLARVVNVPRFVFYSSGAFLTCVSNYLWRNMEGLNGLDIVEFNDFPKPVSFKEEHLPSLCRKYKENDPDWKVVKDGMFGNMESYGVIFNSFEDLEGEYLEFLKKDLRNERVFGVGPLSLLGPASSDRGNPDQDLATRVTKWLDGCPDDSVLYVCFGSQKLLNKNQMIALGLALEKSMVRFIWVVKPGTTQQTEEGYGAVPDGFDERVEGRGLAIRGWAPQVTLLGHKAVGGFLTHCGWNSVLEGIVGGVMILAWPMEADQFVNARLLVEDMAVAVRACEGAESIPDPTNLAEVIAESMRDGGLEKVRAKDLGDKALRAVKEGGSSYNDLNEIVGELHELQLAKHQGT